MKKKNKELYGESPALKLLRNTINPPQMLTVRDGIRLQKKCPKHWWYTITMFHDWSQDLDFTPGGINRFYGHFKIQICAHCFKVRNPK